ncbi:tyrosine-type recombinase/integrase [Clostridium tyrobutyricum]|uniref:tyrosine-type recombinase/integrase n=1 Tax=Clostridium tyrobutyricum TaxID=1519 RepID=UPI002E258C2B
MKHKKFHCLRHTYASKLFANNIPLKTVQVLLGHSNIKTTADIYTHVMPKQKIDAAEKLNSILRLKSN